MRTEGKLIKQLFRWAKSRRLLAENPIADYKLDKPPLEVKEGPSLTQVNQILASISESDRNAIATLSFTGMRRSEMCGLQSGDVDLAGNWINIRSRDGLETKSGLSRKIPIHARLRPLLAAQLNRSRLWLFNEPPTKKTPDNDRPLDPDGLNERFVQAVVALGIPAGRKQNGFTLHSLRHFFETFCVNAGIPQRVVDTWLGHRSDQSMAAVYYKLRDEDSQDFMAKVPFGIAMPALDAGDKEVER